MTTVLREAQGQFNDILTLLNSTAKKDNDYFTKLSIATEEAYFTMNAGMCSNTNICKNCSENRDFIHSIMEILGTLELDSSKANSYGDLLSQYTLRVKDILSKIGIVLSQH